jgi:hypothetical protein
MIAPVYLSLLFQLITKQNLFILVDIMDQEDEFANDNESEPTTAPIPGTTFSINLGTKISTSKFSV